MKHNHIILLFVLLLTLAVSTACCAQDEFVPGTRTSDSYINESIGIRFDIGNNYTMATDEEIQQLMGLGASMANTQIDNLSQLIELANITTLYEMMATNLSDGSSIIVIAEKPILSGTTMDQYVAAYLNSLQTMYTVSEDINSSVEKFCGREWNLYSYNISVSGFTLLYETYFTKVGDRFITLNLSGLSNDALATVASFISCTEQ